MQDTSIDGTILGLYDFGARQYDPVIGRWMAQDPANQHASPYNYCSNNPIALIDPSGMKDSSIIIGGYYYRLVQDINGNYCFDWESQTGSIYDNYGNDITGDYWKNFENQFNLALEAYAFLYFGYHPGQWNIASISVGEVQGRKWNHIGLFSVTDEDGTGYSRGFWHRHSSTIHIAPKLVNDYLNEAKMADVELYAVLHHELLHGLHYFILQDKYDQDKSEAVAYQATLIIYQAHNCETKIEELKTVYAQNYHKYEMGWQDGYIHAYPAPILHQQYNLIQSNHENIHLSRWARMLNPM